MLHLRSFVWVTGPKTDYWLVLTVGAILFVIGVAAVAATCDIVFVSSGVISRIYLLDAAAELALVVGWITCPWLGRRVS